MKIVEMTINNFGSYKDNAIFRFEDDITVYQGPNGAGKSTMIEGIFYAFFGKLAKEGVKDLDYVRLNKKAEVSLTWEHQGEKYVIERTITNKGKAIRTRKLTNLTKKKVWKKESSIQELVIQMLGEMTTIKNSIYSPQGQLHSLLSMQGEELKKELSQIFGIEQYKRLALTWERLSTRANREKSDLEGTIQNLTQLCEQIPDIKDQIGKLEGEDQTLEAKLSQLDKQGKKLEEIQTEKTKIETKIEGFQKNIDEKTPKYEEKKGELERIEASISEDKLKNPEKALKNLNIELGEIFGEIEILDPFIKETETLVNNLEIEKGKLDERSSQLEEGIDGLIEKSEADESPHKFEKEEAKEFIDKNKDLVNYKIEELEKNGAIIQDLLSKNTEINSQMEKDDEDTVYNFISKLTSISPSDFQSDDLSSVEIDNFSKWLEILQKEIISLVKREKELNDSLIESKTKLKSLDDDLKEKEQTLSKLKSGEIETCTECGTKLTPELRKSNQERTTKEIGKINDEIESVEDKQDLAQKELEDQTFKDKIDVIETNNLKNKVEYRIVEISTAFQNYKTTVSTLSKFEKEFDEISSKLKQEWKEKLQKSNIEKIHDELRQNEQFNTSFQEDLIQIEENYKKKKKKEEEIKKIEEGIRESYSKYKLDHNSIFKKLKSELESKNQERSDAKKAIQELGTYQELKQEVKDVKQKLERNEKDKKSKEEELTKPPYNTLNENKKSNETEKKSANDRRREIASELSNQKNELETSEKAYDEKKTKEERVTKLTTFAALADSVGKVFREVRPKLLNFKTKRIVERTNKIVRSMPSQADTLRLDVDEDGDEYNLVVFRNGEKGKLGTVSGGELTGLGFALRVAIAQELSTVGILILDEPTYGLDKSRRSKLAEILVSQKHIKQLLVVTHDEIFNGKTTNITQIRQNNGASRNMADELGIQSEELE
ncbi:MAG: DNA double-strand break repair Rad50 ATPase [Candidatus Heimdallarchaeota archaeon LC_2]|nr:MAG: DNA double-strand break repair Rad50 ATPase [Candidatus Heimdallarchaeota archaeon LC_2]